MIYQPINNTSEELLTVAGYSPEGVIRGWQRSTKKTPKKKVKTKVITPSIRFRKEDIPTKTIIAGNTHPTPKSRFHAYIEGGSINLHYDSPREGNRHWTSKFGTAVEKEVRRIKTLDV